MGCVATISASGTASGTASSGFTLTAAPVEGDKTGLFFYGITGPSAQPWGAGGSSLLCVKAPSRRFATQNSFGTAGQCDGALTAKWNAFIATHPSALGAPFFGGETIHAQAWVRDPPAVKGTILSNALEFLVAP